MHKPVNNIGNKKTVVVTIRSIPSYSELSEVHVDEQSSEEKNTNKIMDIQFM